MAIARPFAYNSGSSIPGTEQIGDLSIGAPTSGFTNNPQYWNGPDEELGYVIAQSVSGNTQPTPLSGVTASVGFFRSEDLTEGSFITLSEIIANQSFANGDDAKTWLNNNGYWTSYESLPSPSPTPTGTPVTVTPTPTNTPTETEVLTPTPTETETPTPTPTPTETETPTPTPTNTETPTETPAETPTNTPTPTSTDSSSITTYTISGCTNLNVLVVDLGPGFIVPGDVNYYTFTGATPSGCYSVIGKINAPIDDAFTTSFGTGGCNDCESTYITPTPTPTNTETPTNTPTPTETPTNTPTPSTTPIPVTGYGYNLVVLPYAPPTSGNTIFPRFTVIGETSGVTTPNTFDVNGVFWNSIDNLSVDRTSYYSGMTGTSVTAYFTQNGDTAIYSGSSTAFTFEGSPGTFNYNPNTRPGQLTLIQSASTDFVTGQTVYISYVVN